MNTTFSRLRRWAGKLVKLLAVVLALGAVIYFTALAPRQIVRHGVERSEIVAEVLGTGTLEARIKSTIGPKISGRVLTVPVDQGQRVTAGQLLFELDDDELRQQVAIAEAEVAASAAALERVRTDKDRALAVLEQASKHHDRVVSLAENNVTSREEVDKAVEALSVAGTDVSRSEAAIAEAQKSLLAAEKALEFQRARLNDTRIAAPFDGLIVRRYRDPGDVVVPGTAVLTLVSTDEMWISAWVDETEMASLASGQPARVVFRSEPGKSYAGKVARLGREADRETREFVVDVLTLELPNNWAVGQRAEVFIETARSTDTVVIPSRFLALQEGRAGVFLDAGRRARWQPVEIGLRGREQVEIISGVQPPQTLVMPADPRTPLKDGQRITVP